MHLAAANVYIQQMRRVNVDVNIPTILNQFQDYSRYGVQKSVM